VRPANGYGKGFVCGPFAGEYVGFRPGPNVNEVGPQGVVHFGANVSDWHSQCFLLGLNIVCGVTVVDGSQPQDKAGQITGLFRPMRIY
jgi:hypothetical protein